MNCSGIFQERGYRPATWPLLNRDKSQAWDSPSSKERLGMPITLAGSSSRLAPKIHLLAGLPDHWVNRAETLTHKASRPPAMKPDIGETR